MKFIETLGHRIFSDNLNKIKLGNQVKVLNTISPNSYGISTKDIFFRGALLDSDYLVLDGVYFALSSILLQGKNIQKNQGPDIFYHFMKRMNDIHGKVFFLGASDETLQKIVSKASFDYPNTKIRTLSPPFKNKFLESENENIINKINEFSPDVLFIGMTCPKQEKWSYQNKNSINAKLICSVGAVFDWYAGNQKNIHPLWWKLRLAWLKRTFDRPEILKRYPSIGIFFWHLFLNIIGIRKD